MQATDGQYSTNNGLKLVLAWVFVGIPLAFGVGFTLWNARHLFW
jgi:hypothetical protein